MYLLVLLRIPGLMNQDTLVVLIQHPERFSDITCTLGQRTAAGNTAREADSYGLMAMDALRPGLWAMDVHVFPIRPFQYKYCHPQKALRRDCRQSPWYLSSSFTAPLLLSWREVSAELCSRAVESSGIATDLCSHHLAVALYQLLSFLHNSRQSFLRIWRTMYCTELSIPWLSFDVKFDQAEFNLTLIASLLPGAALSRRLVVLIVTRTSPNLLRIAPVLSHGQTSL